MDLERKIEKWLRAYAKKRRGQAKDAFDLHPATRRLLQDEIARKVPVPNDDDSTSLWKMFRQRWARLLVVTACILLVATIFTPVVYKVREKAQNTLGMAHLKQIGAAVQISAAQNDGQLPASLDELTNGYLAKEDLSDRKNSKPFVYEGAGKNLHGLFSNAVLAYSAENKDTRDVLLANGQTELYDRKKFEEATNQDLSQAVAMNSRQPESLAPRSREMASAANEPAPSMAPPPAVPMPAAGSISAGAEESPQPTTTASSDLAMNSASTPPAMTLPGAEAPTSVQSDATFSTQLKFGSVAAQPQLAGEAQNAFQNSITQAQPVPVLSNFQVQQNGNALRIVDQDGSVYVGSWRLASQAADNGIVEKSGLQNSDKQSTAKSPQSSVPPAGAPANNLQTAQNYFFRVRGMNRTLKQSVVFTGSLLANFAAVGNAQQTFGGVGGGAYSAAQQLKSASTNQAAQLPWSNLRIAGTAVINRTNHIEVNAAPVTPTK